MDSRPRVTGIGGIFFRSEDPDAAREWYRKNLGIETDDWGGRAFLWTEKDHPDQTGYTVWSPFPDSTRYFDPSKQSFMVNFRVNDLGALLSRMRAAGVTIVGNIQVEENGKFAWVLDPEGRKVELWEPVPSEEDPYLK